jgi:hypothetical protein
LRAFTEEHIAAQFTEELLATALGRITAMAIRPTATAAATAIRPNSYAYPAYSYGSYGYGYPAYGYGGYYRPGLYGGYLGYRIARRVAINRARWR